MVFILTPTYNDVDDDDYKHSLLIVMIINHPPSHTDGWLHSYIIDPNHTHTVTVKSACL